MVESTHAASPPNLNGVSVHIGRGRRLETESAEEKHRCRTLPDRFPSDNNPHMVLEAKGLTYAQIARGLGVSRTTVVKYATSDYSSVPATGREGSRSLIVGEYARKADEWLEADRRMPRKQRHIAQRVHERLVEECGFEGSCSSGIIMVSIQANIY